MNKEVHRQWEQDGQHHIKQTKSFRMTSIHSHGFPWEAPRACSSGWSMNRLGRDPQMCIHITKRQKYTNPNIRFSFLPSLHITGVQMSLLTLQEEGNINWYVQMSLSLIYPSCLHCCLIKERFESAFSECWSQILFCILLSIQTKESQVNEI